MSKGIGINIGEFFLDTVSKPIRDKEDLIVLLLETIKLFLVGNIIDDDKKVGKILLHIDKMSRVFYETENKFFSINFPFNLEIITQPEGTEIRIYDTAIGVNLDQQVISALLSLFSQKILEKESLDDFHYVILTTDDMIGDAYILSKIWSLFRKLLLFESGYLRYDHDPQHENGFLHPLNHLDLYFTTGNTFKVGLDRRINITDLIDILDIQTDCHFVRRPR
jgi:hypothetical protein